MLPQATAEFPTKGEEETLLNREAAVVTLLRNESKDPHNCRKDREEEIVSKTSNTLMCLEGMLLEVVVAATCRIQDRETAEAANKEATNNRS